MLNAGSSNAPQNLGATASAGTGPELSFADHVHARPTVSELGAVSAADKGVASGVASLDSSARLNAVQMPALSGDVVLTAGTTNTSKVEKIQNISVPVPTGNGTMLQFADGLLRWGAAPTGGSGGGGIVMFFNNGTTGDAPLTNLPALTGGQTYKEFRRVAEVGETSVVSPNLTSSYTNIAGFITDVNDPETVEITAGLWDFNVWASTIDNRTLLRAVLYKYDGATTSSTTLATSAPVSVPTVAGQLAFSLVIPQTTIALTDRIFIVFQALNPAANHTVTLQFGGTTPSHAHTTLPSIGKTGVPKVINGVMQPDASLLKNEDIASDAAIEQSKISGLLDALANAGGYSPSSPLALESGGTAASYAGDNRLSRTLLPATIRHNSNLAPAILTGVTLTYTAGSTTVAYSGVAAGLQLVPGMSFAVGALQNAVIRSIDTGTGGAGSSGNLTVSVAPTAPGSSTAGVHNTSLTSFVTASVPSNLDTRVLVVGDIVLLTGQTASALNGPWRVDSITTVVSMSRPTWFRGSLTGGVLFSVQLGASNSAFIVTVFPSTVNYTATIGLDGLSCFNVVGRSANAILGSNTYLGRQTFAGGSATGAPAAFQAGVLLTNPLVHAIEWDGNTMYLTNAAAVRKKVSFLEDNSSIVATAAPSSIVYDIESYEVLYHTANSANDFAVNIRGSAALSLNTVLEVGKIRTAVIMVTNGATAYKIGSVSVDGASQTVKWLGGASPTGNANSIDSYTLSVLKTAANTYTVLGSFVRFA